MIERYLKDGNTYARAVIVPGQRIVVNDVRVRLRINLNEEESGAHANIIREYHIEVEPGGTHPYTFAFTTDQPPANVFHTLRNYLNDKAAVVVIPFDGEPDECSLDTLLQQSFPDRVFIHIMQPEVYNVSDIWYSSPNECDFIQHNLEATDRVFALNVPEYDEHLFSLAMEMANYANKTKLETWLREIIG